MNIFPRIAAAHLRFAREGAAFTLPAPGTVSRDFKPAGEDAAWVNAMGIVDDFTISPNEDFQEVVIPAPGKRVLWDVQKGMSKKEYKWTCQEMSPLAMEVYHDAGPMTGATTQFNPGAGSTRRFWLKVQCFDANNSFLTAFDSFGILAADGDLTMNAEFMKPKFVFKVIYSTLETGTV